MLQVRNETPFVPGVFVFPDPAGIDTLYVTLKATFEIGSREVRVAETQAPIVAADEHWGKPGESSLKYAGEAHPCKPATDVVVVGHPIGSASDKPPPAGVGYVPAWHPRATFAGTYDEAWRKKRAPYLPADFAPRFFQAAPQDGPGGAPTDADGDAAARAGPGAVQKATLDLLQLPHQIVVDSGMIERKGKSYLFTPSQTGKASVSVSVLGPGKEHGAARLELDVGARH